MKKMVFSCLLLALLAASGCFAPPPSGVKNLQPLQTGQSASVQQAGFQVASLPEPEILTFPSMVTPQKLEAVDKTNHGKHISVNFVTEKIDDQSVLIPKTGQFKVMFMGTGRFALRDADARDGLAVIELPTNVLEGFIQARGTPNTSMVYEDPLYYVKQPIDRNNGKPQWYRIGKRQLPIPGDWLTESNTYTITITNNGVVNFSTRWYSTTGQADFPPGMNAIGPEGGVVELPGVAKLEIPAGAIGSSTVVKISQVLQVKKIEELVAEDGHTGIQKGHDFVSPIVKVEPFELKLNGLAKLYLPVDPDKVDHIHPIFIASEGSLTLEPRSWGKGSLVAINPDYHNFSNLEELAQHVTINEPIFVNKFAYFTKTIPTVHNLRGKSFNIQQLNSKLDATSKYFVMPGEKESSITQIILPWLDEVYEFYQNDLSIKKPQGFYPKDVSSELKKIGVFLRSPSGGMAIPEFQNNQSGVETFAGTSLDLGICAFIKPGKDNCDFTDNTVKQSIAEVAAHELFHAFQRSYALGLSSSDASKYLYQFGSIKWFDWYLESTAVYMEGMAPKERANKLGFNFQPKNNGYTKVLQASQALLEESLHARKGTTTPDNIDKKYTGAPFFANVGFRHNGAQKTAQIVNAIGQIVEQNQLPDVLGIINAQLGNVLKSEYHEYAKDAYLKKSLDVFTISGFQMNDVSPITQISISKPAPGTSVVFPIPSSGIKTLPPLAANYFVTVQGV